MIGIPISDDSLRLLAKARICNPMRVRFSASEIAATITIAAATTISRVTVTRKPRIVTANLSVGSSNFLGSSENRKLTSPSNISANPSEATAFTTGSRHAMCGAIARP